MILDAHAHLFHPKWYPAAFGEDVVKDNLQRNLAKGRVQDPDRVRETIFRMFSDDTGNTTVKLMDKVGIDVKVILVLDWGLELGEAPSTIENIHRDILGICSKFKDRLLGFAGIDPRRPQAVELMTRAFDEWGAVGLKLHPTGGWRMSDESTHRVVALAAERKLPVLVHIGKTMDILRDDHASPEALIELARCFPASRFIAGHSGFELFETFINEPNLPENVYFDVSAWQPWLQTDKPLLLARLGKLVQAFPKRVCYGSDSPFFTYNLINSEKEWLGTVRDFLASQSPEMQAATAGVLSGQDVFKIGK